MKYCQHCGGEIHDEAVVCIHCGRAVQNTTINKSNYYSDSMKSVIWILLVLSCVLGAFALLIPLAWCIPISLAIKKKLDKNEPIDMGLKICTLLLVNVIVGILLLCGSEIENL